MKKDEKKLLELHQKLELKLDVIQRLRMQLIDKKIDSEAQIRKLKIKNNKLVEEIYRNKLAEAELKKKQKLKQKKAIT